MPPVNDASFSGICYANETFSNVLQFNPIVQVHFAKILYEHFFYIILSIITATWYLYSLALKTFHHGGTDFPRDTEVPRGFPKMIKSQSAMALINATTVAEDILDRDKLQAIVDEENLCPSQEDPKDYRTGGYMPLGKGDILDDKYEIVRKLGYGQFSTVWLAKNQVQNTFVAIKAGKGAQLLRQYSREEIEMLRFANDGDEDHPGYRHVVQMIDFFDSPSIYGLHTIIVLEAMGPSLLHFIKQSKFMGIEPNAAKGILKQIILGLQYLHEDCELIHTDIKPENILIKISDSYIRHMANEVEQMNVLGINPPRNYVASNVWQDSDGNDTDEMLLRNKSYPEDKLLNKRRKSSRDSTSGSAWINSGVQVKIGDLGNATKTETVYNSNIQTRQYRALEVIIRAGYNTPADMWSLGCLAFELVTGEFLFYPGNFGSTSTDMHHLTLIWETLGGIPPYVLNRGRRTLEFFNYDGKFLHIDEDQLRVWRVENVLVDKYGWKRVDAIPFAGFIDSLIEPDPGLRITATDALKSDWLADAEQH